MNIKKTLTTALKENGYHISEYHHWRKPPNMISIVLDRNKSKIQSFFPIRNIFRNIPTDRFLQINIGWSEESIQNFTFGCTSTGYDIGTTEKMSVYHVNHPHWEKFEF